MGGAVILCSPLPFPASLLCFPFAPLFALLLFTLPYPRFVGEEGGGRLRGKAVKGEDEGKG